MMIRHLKCLCWSSLNQSEAEITVWFSLSNSLGLILLWSWMKGNFLNCSSVVICDHIQFWSTFIKKKRKNTGNHLVNPNYHHQICMTLSAYACRNSALHFFYQIFVMSQANGKVNIAPYVTPCHIEGGQQISTINLLFPHCTNPFYKLYIL